MSIFIEYLILILLTSTNTSGINSGDLKTCRLISLSRDGLFAATSEYRYDDTNRLVQNISKYKSGGISYAYYAQDSVELIYTDKGGVFTTISKYYINSEGFAENCTSVDYERNAEGIHYISRSTTQSFEYDEHGHLIYFEKVPDKGSPSFTKYFYENDNLISTTSNHAETSYNYYPDKANNLEDTHSIFGRRNLNLLKSTKRIKETGGTRSGINQEIYRYDFDKNDRVIRKYTTLILDKGEEKFVTTYDWECL